MGIQKVMTTCSVTSEQGRVSEELTIVVPAECMLYERPEVFINLCTSAIWAETEAVDVPMGIRQKSAVHFCGVLTSWFAILRVCVLLRKGGGERCIYSSSGEAANDDVGLGGAETHRANRGSPEYTFDLTVDHFTWLRLCNIEARYHHRFPLSKFTSWAKKT